jgi:hypothetical protein
LSKSRKSVQVDRALCHDADNKKAVLRRLFAFALLQRTRFKRRQEVLSRDLPGW